MKTRIIFLSLVLVATVAWWELRPGPTLAPEPDEASSPSDQPQHVASARHDDPPVSTPVGPTVEHPEATPSDPLVRHRDRLRTTAFRLAARREDAVAGGAPEPTVQALDAHLARVEQRLADLEMAVATGVAVGGAVLPATTTAARP
jgi:hypothetical protein